MEDEEPQHPMKRMLDGILRDAQQKRDTPPDIVIDVAEELIEKLYELSDANSGDEVLPHYHMWKWVGDHYPQTRGHDCTLCTRNVLAPQIFIYLKPRS